MKSIKYSIIEIYLFKLIVLLIIFPEVGLIRFPSDTQPYFFIFSILAIFIGYKRLKNFDFLLFPFLVILIFATISFIITTFNTINLFPLFRSYFGYLSSFTILLYLFIYKDLYNAKNLTPVFDFCIFIIYLGFLLNLVGLNWFVQLFVNRAEFRLDGIRGLVSFYSEQSNMVSVCFIMFFSYLHIGSLNKMRGFALFSAIILSASGQAILELIFVVLFYLVSLFIIFFSNKKIAIKNIIYFIIPISITFILFLLFKNLDLNFRAFKVFSNFTLDTGLYILGSDYSTTWKVQGLFLAIATMISTPFNFQISSLTETNAFENLNLVHSKIYEFVFGVSNPKFGDRVYSAFGTWIVDFGLYGFVLYIIFLMYFFKRTIFNKKIDAILITSVFYVLYSSLLKISLSFPTILLTIFSTYNYIDIKYNYTKQC